MKKALLILISTILVLNTYSQNEKYVVVMEGTGTWCGFCPRGIVVFDEFTTPDSAFLIPICIHDDVGVDPMIPTGLNPDDSLFYTLGYPSFMFDFIDEVQDGPEYTDGLNNLTTEFNTRRQEHPPIAIEVESNWNETTREISIDVTADFDQDLSGDYRFNAIIVEDSVTGPSPEYNQTNYYAWVGYPCPIYDTMPDPVPANQMIYMFVARHLFAGQKGIENSLPTTINNGDSYTHNFTYTLPADYDENQIKIVGWVCEADGRIVNANYRYLIDETTNIYSNNIDNQIKIYPNPAKTSIKIKGENIEQICIINSKGQIVCNNKHTSDIDVSYYTKGIYIVKIILGDRIITRKLIIN